MMSIVRALPRRFGRNRILKRNLPPDLGTVPILVSPEASLGFWKPGVKSDLFDFAREFVQPGNVVWDVGSNLGLLTIAAAQRAGNTGKVIAIDADIWLVELLRKSARIQPPSSASIQVLPAAVSDSLKIAALNIAQNGRAANFLSDVTGSSQTGGIRETVSVISITLDWLLEQGIAAPQVLKIDTEGAETSILCGAERLISEVRPLILCEVFDESREAVTEILLRNKYTLFDWDSKPRTKIDHACLNTLAIPSV
jgi:FkbM family methyltransferase